MNKARRPTNVRWLAAMLIGGIGCFIAGGMAANHSDRTYFPSQPLLQESVYLYPSQADIRVDKKYQLACPAAFPAGSHMELYIRVDQRIASVTDIAGVPLWRNVQTSVTTHYWDRTSAGISKVPDDALRAAMECVPSLKGKPLSLLTHAESASVLIDWPGVTALAMIPFGLVLAIPPLLILPIRTLRRLRARRTPLTGA